MTGSESVRLGTVGYLDIDGGGVTPSILQLR